MVNRPSSPRVSVIIPTHNRPRLLIEAVSSVLSQTFQDFQIVIIDDGSTTDTIDRAADLDTRIRYLKLNHSGRPGLVRNRGIELAEGDLIAFLDDDDFWRGDKLDKQIQLMDAQKRVGFVYSDVRFVHPDRSISGPVLRPHQKDAASLLGHLLADCFIYPSTVLIRRICLEQVGLFDENLRTGEDYHLWLRLARTTGASCVSEPLTFIRRHPAGVSQQSEILAFRNAISVLEDFSGTAHLTFRQRLRSRATLSRWYAHVGLRLLRDRNRSAARRYFLHSLWLNPFQRRAWIALAQSGSAKLL